MVGGEAVPKTGAEIGAKVEFDAKAVSQPECTAGEAVSETVTGLTPADAYDHAREQPVWKHEPKGKPGYTKFSGMTSEIDVSQSDVGAPELLTAEEFLKERTSAFTPAEKEAFGLLFKENSKAADGKKLTVLELENTFDNTMGQFARIRATSNANKVPLENLPNIVESGLAEGFAAHQLPAKFAEVMKPEVQQKVARSVANSRAKGVMVNAGIGGGVWWASMELADAIGIENRTLHFGFVIYTMDTSMAAGQATRGIVAARMGGASWGAALGASPIPELFAGETVAARLLSFTRKGIAGPPVRAMLHIGPGLLYAQLGGAGVRAYGVCQGMSTEEIYEELGDASMIISTGSFFLPGIIADAAGGSAAPATLGVGLAADIAVAAMVAELLVEGGQEMYDSEYDYRVSLETRMEERYLELTMEKQFELLDGLPEWLQSRLFNLFVAERTLEDFVGVFAPSIVRRGRALSYHLAKGNGLFDPLGGYEFWPKDYEDSKKMLKELPDILRKTLGSGIDGQSDTPEFYNEVSFGWMDSKLEADGNVAAKVFDEEIEKYRKTPNYKAVPKEKRLEAELNYMLTALGDEETLQEAVSFKQAFKAQRSLISLHAMDLIDGEPIREIMNRDGAIMEGKEDEFLMQYVAPAYDDLGPDATADDVRERILEDRKVVLVRRILTAEADYDEVPDDLMELAGEAGLVGADGNLLDGEVYRTALEELTHEMVFMQDGDLKEVFEYHSAKVFEEIVELSGRSDLSNGEAVRLKALAETDSFMRAKVEEENEANLKAVKMAAAKIRVQDFVMAKKTPANYGELRDELNRRLDKLALTPEEREEMEELRATLEIHSSIPPPASMPEGSAFDARAGRWAAPKKIGR